MFWQQDTKMIVRVGKISAFLRVLRLLIFLSSMLSSHHDIFGEMKLNILHFLTNQ